MIQSNKSFWDFERSSVISVTCLLRQMEELLKEVALSERKKQQIDLFVQKVTKLLQNVHETPEVEVRHTLTGGTVPHFLIVIIRLQT